MKVISAENISKEYKLGSYAKDSIRDSFLSFFKSKKVTSKKFKALDDISFSLEKGEVLGIVGKNGAGKSTLLKVLSRITEPSTGKITLKGRVASLLEVGTGFHPELTGRENVFLNGSILGMTKMEISSKFDEIVEFSGVSKFIDTPVKNYSSGMYVRLAFSVAAHLEPEILIIDEVLAVGDAEFQKKCLGKMKDVASQGRTVLFVSHNMAAVKTLCTRGILLEKGKLVYEGEINNLVNRYLTDNSESLLHKRVFKNISSEGVFDLEEISVYNVGHEDEPSIEENKEIELRTKVNFLTNEPERYHVTYHLINSQGEALFSFSSRELKPTNKKGHNTFKCFFPSDFLMSGSYILDFYFVVDNRTAIKIEKNILGFNIVDGERKVGSYMGREPGSIRPKLEWTNTI